MRFVSLVCGIKGKVSQRREPEGSFLSATESRVCVLVVHPRHALSHQEVHHCGDTCLVPRKFLFQDACRDKPCVLRQDHDCCVVAVQLAWDRLYHLFVPCTEHVEPTPQHLKFLYCSFNVITSKKIKNKIK